MCRDPRTEDDFTYSSLLKACAQKKDLQKGSKLHADILKKGLLEKSLHVASSLISLYSKCGLIAKAQELHADLLVRDVASWNALIAGFAQLGQGEEALDCFHRMQNEGLSPNSITLVCVLKACSSIRDINKGKQIHEKIVTAGMLENDIMIGTALIGMYAKCGVPAEAQKILEQLPYQNVVSWNALITGYIQEGQYHQALHCFERMQSEGVCPNAVTFVCILKACADTGSLERGEQIHEQILKDLLDKDITVGNALVNMYAKCRMLEKAGKLLENMPLRDVVSWNVMIAGYSQQGLCQQALDCFEKMRGDGLSPDRITFICILEACSKAGAIEKGMEIHKTISRIGLFMKDIKLGNALVDMYAKCGELTKAHETLNLLPIQNVVSWNSLIEGYVLWGQDYEALNCLEFMKCEGLSPDETTFLSALKACNNAGAIYNGQKLHIEILGRGLLNNSVILGTALVSMYVKCNALPKAHQVLEEITVRDVVVWSVIIDGFAKQGKIHETRHCVEVMKSEGLTPNSVTFICILRVCSKIGDIDMGKNIHEEITSKGLVQKDIVLSNALIDMYGNCGLVENAKLVLEEIPERDVITWNTLIAGYAKQEQGQQGLNCFQHMQREGVCPDGFSLIYILKACGATGSIQKGKQIHSRIVNMDFLEKEDVMLGTALVDMYVKCGLLEKAQLALQKVPVRNVVPWNALITGYAQNGLGHEVLNCYQQMKGIGICMDEVTFISILKGCGSIGAIHIGEEIHDEIVSGHLLQKDVFLGTALVDMYSKCHMLAKAKQVIEGLPVQDAITWSALIAGYARQRQAHEALNCFQRMERQGFQPDGITFLCVLSACCHSGLMHEAEVVFVNMIENYGIIPSIAHHTCLMLAFGYAGHFDEAISIIQEMPSCDDLSVWLILLGACRKWANIKLAQVAFDQAVQLNGTSAAAHVLMANIFADAGMQEDVEKLEDMRFKYAWNVTEAKHPRCTTRII